MVGFGMAKKAYITTLGRSTWALVNTYYAVLREKKYFPDRVYVFTERAYKNELGVALSAIQILNEEFKIKPKVNSNIFGDVDFLAAGKEIFNIVKQLKLSGYKVAIDITPGRKALVVASLITGIKVKIDSVFYLAISDTEDVAKPYMMIPLHIQQLRDFMEDTKGVMQ